ncbi:MAG: hypothetical protein AB7P69_02115 [Candidatus Binatia bacterium]
MFLLLFFVFLACQSFPLQTGHQEIASAVRALLDQSYAGIDYPTYQGALKKVETTSATHREDIPYGLRDQVQQILAYLRTAEEILRWQSQRHLESERQASDPTVRAWIERYPFLQAAVGARSQGIFDAPTAATLLWDKTDEVLRELQIKSAPL